MKVFRLRRLAFQDVLKQEICWLLKSHESSYSQKLIMS
jgi:hypothetical protein